jgi:hypothetical protein
LFSTKRYDSWGEYNNFSHLPTGRAVELAACTEWLDEWQAIP